MQYTRKQVKMILMLADGLSTIDVASEMDISAQTVSNHRKRIMNLSPYKNWNHFMAETGRSGQLEEWSRRDSLRPNPWRESDPNANEEQERITDR